MRYAGRNHHEVLHLFSFVYSLGRRRGIIRTGSYPTLSPGRMLRFVPAGLDVIPATVEILPMQGTN